MAHDEANVPGAGFCWGLLKGGYFHCEVLLTYRCNLSCDFCSFWRQTDPVPCLSAEDWGKVSEELARAGRLIVSIEGGEPFLRDDLAEVVGAFARHHAPMIYTNGTAVTFKRARDLYRAGLWQAGVSLDYADAARHDARRGRSGTHAAALHALELLRDAAPLGGEQVHAITLLLDDNTGELPALLEMTAGLGVGHQVTLVSPSRARGAGGAHVPPRSGVGRTLAALRDKFRHLNTFDRYLQGVDHWLAGDSVPSCRAGMQGFTIGPAGDVCRCNELLHESAGNIAEGGWAPVRKRLKAMAARECNECYTLCRGTGEALDVKWSPWRMRKALRGFGG